MESVKLNLEKIDKEYYNAVQKPEIEVFGIKRYLSIEGRGAPGGEEYQNMISVLYSLAYEVKNQVKSRGKDFVVPKLECLWWPDEGKNMERMADDQWNWRLMIRVPDIAVHGDIQRAKNKILNEKAMIEVSDVKITRMTEGKCVQALHIGPYQDVGETYDKILTFLKEKKLKVHGRFHEIYLSDPSKTSPEKLKTIVRIPAASL